jgi:S1-C subfamily serine protease
MEDLKILEAIERYINGQMSADERMYFEQLRKTNPEIDQAVVEHTFFLQQINRFDSRRKFKGLLNDVHIDLAEKGAIKSPRLQGKAKVVYLFNRYKRVAAIAASIAGITALTISVLIASLDPGKPTKQDLQVLNRKIQKLEEQNKVHENAINNIGDKVSVPTQPSITYKTGGTGFLIDTKGYIVTSQHIVAGATNIAVQNAAGKDFSAQVVYSDTEKDLAILKIDDKSFKSPSSIPYSIRQKSSSISEPVYTLGFPRNDIVYGEGYLAAKTGYNGDTLSCQIAIAANPGNSGGPVLNKNGEVIGILTAKQTTAEGVVFAIQSRYIYQALQDLKKDSLKLKSVSNLKGLDRTQQVKKLQDFVYMVKVN